MININVCDFKYFSRQDTWSQERERLQIIYPMIALAEVDYSNVQSILHKIQRRKPNMTRHTLRKQAYENTS
jgi:hypothetical protein